MGRGVVVGSGLKPALPAGIGRVGRSLIGRCRRIVAASLNGHRRVAQDERGAVVVIVAFVLPVAIGAMGLGAETGYWYFQQRDLQHVADLATHAAGVRKRSGDDTSAITQAAATVAANSGFTSTSGTMQVNTPPATGAHAGDSNAVEVVLGKQLPRFFSVIFDNSAVAIDARAVAVLAEGSRACVLALSPAAPAAVTVSGSAEVELEGCDVASNSLASDAFYMQGTAAEFAADCVHTVGEAQVTTKLELSECEAVDEYAPVVPDPYADIEEPVLNGACEDGTVGKSQGTTVVTPTNNHPSGVPSARYCGGLTVKGDVVFKAGLYIIDGGTFTINGNASVSGEGVTFYLTGGASLKFNGTAEIDLSAPTSGPYSGLLFFGDRGDSGVTHTINGNAESELTGAIYLSAGDIEFRGDAEIGDGCVQIIGDTVTFSGSSSLELECDDDGTRDIWVNQAVKIVE